MGFPRPEGSKTLPSHLLLIMKCSMMQSSGSNQWTIPETLIYIGEAWRFSCRQWQLMIWGRGIMNSMWPWGRSGLMMKSSLLKTGSSLERDFFKKITSHSWSSMQREVSLRLLERESTRKSLTSTWNTERKNISSPLKRTSNNGLWSLMKWLQLTMNIKTFSSSKKVLTEYAKCSLETGRFLIFWGRSHTERSWPLVMETRMWDSSLLPGFCRVRDSLNWVHPSVIFLHKSKKSTTSSEQCIVSSSVNCTLSTLTLEE